MSSNVTPRSRSAIVIRATIICILAGIPVSALASCLLKHTEEFGQALGTLFSRHVLEDYDVGTANINLRVGVARSLGLSSEAAKQWLEEDAEAEVPTMSIASAEQVISNWHSKRRKLGERFMQSVREQSEYSFTQIRSTEIYFRVLDANLSDANLSELSCDLSEWRRSEDTEIVCFRRKRLAEEDLCVADDSGVFGPAAPRWQSIEPIVGSFKRANVIEGWQELFDRFDSAKQDENQPNRGELIELVVPPEHAYGTEGIGDTVEPNEVLWFLIQVAGAAPATD